MYYAVEVYLPHPIQDSALVKELRKQWSNNFGGTTSFEAEGTYLGDPPEKVTIIKLFVPDKFGKDEVLSYFTARREELAKRFPDQKAFLVTFAPNNVTFL